MLDSNLEIGQKLKIQAPSELEAHVIDTRQWQSLRGRVESLANLEKNFSSAAWAFVGLAISGAIALLTWLPAYLSLNQDGRTAFAWIWVVLAAVTILGVGVAVSLFVANRAIKDAKSTSVSSVLDDMDALIQ